SEAAAGGKKIGEFVGIDAGLLRLAAGVHLDEEGRAAADGLCGVGDTAGEALAVDGVDGVEELNRAADLVRLQRPDEVELDIRVFLPEGRPAGLGLLHAVLAED